MTKADGATILENGGSEMLIIMRPVASLWLLTLLQLLKIFSTYRQELLVEELMVFSDGMGYYVCPRCRITLERDFVSFCDRCGQRLGWRRYKNVRIIHPNRRENENTQEIGKTESYSNL